MMMIKAGLVRPATAGNIWFEGGVFGSAAIRGYDVVAYFTQGKPVEGKSDYSHKWNNTSWRFASAAHRDLFAANPEKYDMVARADIDSKARVSISSMVLISKYGTK